MSGLAAKAVKEVAYHRELSADWTIKLRRRTDESKARMAKGSTGVGSSSELFEVDAGEMLVAMGTVPDPRSFEDEYRGALAAVLAEATLDVPAEQRPILGGRRGHHSEHLGHLLAVMQHLPRTYPSALVGTWPNIFTACGWPRSCPRPTRPTRSGSRCPRVCSNEFCFRAGQHLTYGRDIGGRGNVAQLFGLCVAPDEGLVKVTVKRIAGGVFSNWVARR